MFHLGALLNEWKAKPVNLHQGINNTIFAVENIMKRDLKFCRILHEEPNSTQLKSWDMMFTFVCSVAEWDSPPRSGQEEQYR